MSVTQKFIFRYDVFLSVLIDSCLDERHLFFPLWQKKSSKIVRGYVQGHYLVIKERQELPQPTSILKIIVLTKKAFRFKENPC